MHLVPVFQPARLHLLLQAVQCRLHPPREPVADRLLFSLPSFRLAQDERLLSTRNRDQFHLYLVAHLLPVGFLFQVRLELLHLAPRRAHQILPVPLPDRRQIRFADDAAIHHPDPPRLSILALHHAQDHFQRGHVRAVPVEDFVAAREPLRIHDQRQHQLLAIRTMIPRIAAPHHGIGFGCTLHIGARQVVQHHIEQHLKQRYGELFGAEFDVMLYDLTSTYVEGAAEANPMMRRGYSRDHRPDCQQLVLALIVNPEGFPCSYEVFNGNRADVTTLEVILRMVERKYGKARRIWVMDRGIVSEANLAAIRKRDGQYLVGTPRSKMKEFEAHLKQEANWEQVRDEVQVKLISIPGGTETFILCKTEGRQRKEHAIRNRFARRMEAALDSLQKQVKAGRLKNRDKMHVRIGRILASHPQVADLYEVAVKEASGQLSIEWSAKDGQRQWREAREGAYLLRTNLTATTASELWAKYMQLTEVEAAFRALKSELSIRPLFHQLERRVKAHVMVGFLGYVLWVTLKHLLRRKQ